MPFPRPCTNPAHSFQPGYISTVPSIQPQKSLSHSQPPVFGPSDADFLGLILGRLVAARTVFLVVVQPCLSHGLVLGNLAFLVVFDVVAECLVLVVCCEVRAAGSAPFAGWACVAHLLVWGRKI